MTKCPPHHWLIPSKGIVVVGRCKKCKATRQFVNLWQTAWEKTEKEVAIGKGQRSLADTYSDR